MRRRVAITGLGGICALGNSVQEIWSGLSTGRSGIAPIQSVDASRLQAQQGAEVRGFEAGQYFESSKAELMDRFCQLALVAAREAIRDSGMKIAIARGESSESAQSDEVGVIVGTGGGAMATADQVCWQSRNGRVHPFSVPRFMASAACSHISMEFGMTGPAFTVSSACSSATHAIGQAFWMVRSGQLTAALTGGAEAPFCLPVLKAWEAMRVLSPDVCRPFSAGRSGIVLGEGAAMLLLEEMNAACARGARIYGEVVGFGMSSDASHITQPTLAGPVKAMRAALCDAELAPERIGHINAHGTGTPINDPIESRAIRTVFGDHTNKLPVTSTKSMHGHALGASGAIEAIAAVLALRHGVLPPTINFTAPDPECDVDVVANCPREWDAEYALSNSFAFGGLNAVLAFRRAE